MSCWGKSTYRTELTYINTDVLQTRQNALTAAQCMSPGSIVSTGMSPSYFFNHATPPVTHKAIVSECRGFLSEGLHAAWNV